MVKGYQVLEMLIPEGGWTIYGDDFDSIVYDNGELPITKEQFENGFAQYDLYKTELDAAKENERTALLTRIGLTAEELKTLLGGI
jgi:hypothetical protein